MNDLLALAMDSILHHIGGVHEVVAGSPSPFLAYENSMLVLGNSFSLARQFSDPKCRPARCDRHGVCAALSLGVSSPTFQGSHLMPTTAELIQNLPTALASTWRRRAATVSSDFRGRFDNALISVEATIKFVTITAVSLLTELDNDVAHAIAYDLARADGIGQWVTQLQRACGKLSRSNLVAAKTMARLLTRKIRSDEDEPHSPWPVVQALRIVLEHLDEPDFVEAGGVRKALLDVIADFAFVRNRTRGHGAKTVSFYEKVAAAAEAATDALATAIKLPASWFSFLSVGGPGEAVFLRLLGPLPSEHVAFPCLGAPGTNSLFLVHDAARPMPCSKLVQYDSAAQAFYFANGAWREASLKGQFIDYATGNTLAVHLPEFGGPRPTLPPSHTAGTELRIGLSAFHNLPDPAPLYVERKKLESLLSTLLKDKVHRVLTLKGPGGIGKTSLALQVLADFVSANENPFGEVVWFSARDVDLLVEGPVARRRDIGTLEGMAKLYAQLFQGGAETALSAFVDCIAGKGGATLLVLDNFETVDDPEGIHRFLDANVILPCKVLITSRHASFKGDFPVDVSGMEDAEARELLIAEARASHCEPQLTEKKILRIIEATDRSPYAMKLAIGQLAGAGYDIETVLSRALRRDEVLDALFDRSFASLSDSGKFLYLFLGQIGRATPVVILHGLMSNLNQNYFEAEEEVLRLSLASRTEDSQGQASIGLPYAACLHAQRELLGYADEIRIKKEVQELRRLVHSASTSQAIDHFLTGAVKELRASGVSTPAAEKLLLLCESCAKATPDKWLFLASQLQSQLAPEKIRVYYKHAVQADPNFVQAWCDWAVFEKREGNIVQSVYKSIRAIEVGEVGVIFCSQAAADLLRIMREPGMKDQFPPRRRSALSGALRHQLHQHQLAGSLDAEDLGRLGWLYLAEYSPEHDPHRTFVQKAKQCAEEALAQDSQNEHCLSLLDKCRTSLRR